MSRTFVVIGGGAAGFFCAVNAARLHPELRVILLERSGKLLSKVRISGGGRCNLTHSCFDIDVMSRQYPRGGNFTKKTFHQFFTPDTIQWFEGRGVLLKTEKDGRMFPVSDSSSSIIECLLKEAASTGVEIRMNWNVRKLISRKNGFLIESEKEEILADRVCIATGGSSKPEMFNWIRELGHSIEEPVPSLFTFNLPRHPITSLMGVSVARAKAKIAGTKLEQEGAVLITHWGLSGPAILKLSAWGARELAKQQWKFKVLINWMPDDTEGTLITKLSRCRFEIASQKMKSHNAFGLPQRLWEFILAENGIDIEKRWADLSSKEQNRLSASLTKMEFQVSGKTSFKEEFVTAGGVRLTEVDPNSLESRKQKGLYFAGEVLDVDGVTGGFNFQHAWTSGFIAAQLL